MIVPLCSLARLLLARVSTALLTQTFGRDDDARVRRSIGVNTTVRGMARSASGDVVAVGDGGVLLELQSRTVSWQQRTLPASVAAAQTDLLAVWLSSTDAWAVGASATVVRCPTSGAACMTVELPMGVTSTLRGVSGIESTALESPGVGSPILNSVQRLQLWLVGEAGLVLHFNGTAWAQQSVGTAATLRGVFALSATDVVACGDSGTLIRFDGTSWSAISSGTSNTLHGVWAASATSIWVVGDQGTLLFCNGGASCQLVTTPTTAALYAVSGTREYDVFAVGAGGVAIYKHYSGQWRKAGCASGSECSSISPHGADLFAAAAGGLCVFYGTERVGAGADGGPALELAGTNWHSPALKLYCGGGGRRDFARHNLLTFEIRSPNTTITRKRVATSGAEFALLRLSTWNQRGAEVRISRYIEGQTIDTMWRRVQIPLADLWCTQTCPVGTFVFDHGGRCCNVGLDQSGGAIGYSSATCQGDNAIACPFDSCCENADSTWMLHNVQEISIRNTSIGCGTPADGTSCHVFQLRDISVVDDGALPTNDRHSNDTLSSAIITASTIRGMGRSVSDEMVAVGDGGVILQLQSQDMSWQQRTLPASVAAAQTDLLAVWLSSTDAWAVGVSATVVRCPLGGGACVKAALPAGLTAALRGVAGVESTAYVQASARAPVLNPVPTLALWVVGDSGLVWYFDGTAWAQQSVGTAATLRGVFALSATDVVACGDSGTLIRFDGTSWSAISSGTSNTLHGVWAASATSIWVVGDQGTLLFCNGGASCQLVTTPTTAALYAVSGTREYDVFAVGAGGVAIYKHYSGQWRKAGCASGSECSSISPHGADLFAAAAGGLCVFYGTERVGAGADGGPALELAGTNWHSPALKLYCHAGPRRDLCDQNVLRFHVRSAGPEPLYPTVKLSTWDVTGPAVSVATYLDSGTATGVDATWRRVTIPLTDLATTNWRLWNVGTVTWGNMSTGCGDPKASVLPRACQQLYVSGLETLREEGLPTLCAADDALREGLPERIPPSTTNGTIRGVARALGGSCAAPRPMMMVECKGDAQLWACGDGGYLAHTDPATMEWVADTSPVSSTLHDIVVLSPTEMWACGAGGIMLNGNGVVWVEWAVPVSSSVELFALDALARDQVWAVGSDNTLLFFDGASWSSRQLGGVAGRSLRGVSWYMGDDFLGYPPVGMIVGDGGAIFKSGDPKGGGTWTAVSHSLTSVTLHSVAVPRHTDAWAVGDSGTVLHFDGHEWAAVHSAGTTDDLYVVEAYRARTMLAAGANGTLLWYHWSHLLQRATTPTKKDLYAVANLGQCVFFGQEVLGRGQNGGHALMFSPDLWHTNALRLYCGSQYRRNLAPYDAIEFHVRALTTGVGSATFSMGKWDQQSKTVRLADYVEGGVFDNRWRRVFIPLDDLRTPQWTLGGTSTLAWGNLTSCAFGNRGSYRSCEHFLVDDIRVLDLTPPFVANYSVESDRVIRLVINEPYDPYQAKDVSQYKIVSATDTAYASLQPAVDVGIWVHFEGFLPGGFSPDNVYELFVRFDKPFRNGHSCELRRDPLPQQMPAFMPRTHSA